MAVTSASSLEDVIAQYEDNCDYDLDNSVAKCVLFIQAARIYLRRMLKESENDKASIQDDYQKIYDELAKAESWWKTNGSDTGARKGVVRHLSFLDYRS
jgi:hypothetical protein